MGKRNGKPMGRALVIMNVLGMERHRRVDLELMLVQEVTGREGKWYHVIGRDVACAFGIIPPHHTGARFCTDSVVRALVTWEQGRVMKRGVKGGGEELPTPTFEGRRQRVKPRQSTAHSPWEVGDNNYDITDANQTPTETVSGWGGVLPIGGFASDEMSKIMAIWIDISVPEWWKN